VVFSMAGSFDGDARTGDCYQVISPGSQVEA
jgi:hypothetical protein